MQFSTERISKMNVSKEADKAFMLELKRTDPKRYNELDKAIRIAAIQQTPKAA